MSEAIGYLRVSTREQGRSGLGLAAQRFEIEAFGTREGFSVYRWYNPTSNEMGNHIEVDIAGNDISNNYYGLRFQVFGAFKYPYAQTANMAVNVHDNRFMDNDGYPFSVEQGFVFRGTSNYWTNPSPDDNFFGFLATPFITHGPFDGPHSANVIAIFDHNLWKNPDVTPIAPAILTFSYIEVYDPATGAPDPSAVPVYTYMHDSRLNFVDHD